MAGDSPVSRDWDAVLACLSNTIQFKSRADANNWREAFENMNIYMQRLGIEQDVKHKLKVIHVAGTKGKGSTCAMVEAMLRESGYRTGLFTSPHLVDVRERIRINGAMVDQTVFQDHFWGCYDRFREEATEEVGVPGYFRFMTLLALRIFLASKIDVAIVEVGIGGRLDATNCVTPVVCGITSLGMDHMEMLGDTLPKIAREKAGILKPGIPGFTVQQPEDALEALQDCASKATTSLSVVPPLDTLRLEDDSVPVAEVMSLGGAHMLVNAGLAVKLASEWERMTGCMARSGTAAAARLASLERGILPAEYARGLQKVQWPGRSQVVEDEVPSASAEITVGQSDNGKGRTPGAAVEGVQSSPSSAVGGGGRLSFFIDGAHTPESMETCAHWFADQCEAMATAQPAAEVRRVLLFNCMKERDPGILLPTLSKVLASRGLGFHQALFVPPDSQYGFLAGTASAAGSGSAESQQQQQQQQQPPPLDISWQLGMQQLWERQGLGVVNGSGSMTGGGGALRGPSAAVPPLPSLPVTTVTSLGNVVPQLQDARWGAVVPSPRPALEWLRRSTAVASRSTHIQVLVTGSLYLVGDVLRILGRAPK